MSDELQERVAELRHRGLYRKLRTLEDIDGTRAVIDGQEVLVLCSNDYLGLRSDPRVRGAAADAAERWGAGSGSSRLVSGNLALHDALERELAEFKGHERSVLFGSGYLANLGVVSALAGPGDLILSDELNHASIVDACRLSRAEVRVYRHGDLDELGSILSGAPGRRTLIVSDGVFSMDGDLAPVLALTELARRHGARIVIDEAHATGVLGSGRGLVAELGLEREVDVVIGTLSKALGSYGAFACCSESMAAYLINRARTLIFSTALPPPSAAAGLQALRILRGEPERVARLHERAHLIRSELSALGLGVSPGDMPIVPLVLGDPGAAVHASEAALEAGVFAQAIRPPTVPEGTSRLRVAISAAHEPAELVMAAHVLAQAAGAGQARPQAI